MSLKPSELRPKLLKQHLRFLVNKCKVVNIIPIHSRSADCRCVLQKYAVND